MAWLETRSAPGASPQARAETEGDRRLERAPGFPHGARLHVGLSAPSLSASVPAPSQAPGAHAPCALPGPQSHRPPSTPTLGERAAPRSSRSPRSSPPELLQTGEPHYLRAPGLRCLALEGTTLPTMPRGGSLPGGWGRRRTWSRPRRTSPRTAVARSLTRAPPWHPRSPRDGRSSPARTPRAPGLGAQSPPSPSRRRPRSRASGRPARATPRASKRPAAPSGAPSRTPRAPLAPTPAAPGSGHTDHSSGLCWRPPGTDLDRDAPPGAPQAVTAPRRAQIP